MKTICITCKADCHNAGTLSRIVDCSQYKPGRVLTNADHIRAMSDEELAKWLMIAGICIRDFEDCQCDGVSCRQCRLNWLQQPAEEET